MAALAEEDGSDRVSPNLHCPAKKRTEYACFGQNLRNIYILINWKMSLLSLGCPGSPTTAFPSRDTSFCTDPGCCGQSGTGVVVWWDLSWCTALLGSIHLQGRVAGGEHPGLRPAPAGSSACTSLYQRLYKRLYQLTLPRARTVEITKRYLVTTPCWKQKA